VGRGPVWTGGKSRPYRDSIPDRPTRSQSLYRLSYPANIDYICVYIYVCVYIYIYIYIYTCSLLIIEHNVYISPENYKTNLLGHSEIGSNRTP